MQIKRGGEYETLVNNDGTPHRSWVAQVKQFT